MSDYLDPNNEELLKDFYMEADLQVEILEQNILVLENNPDNMDSVDEIFRAAHTLKGASATVQMNELAGFTHIVEDLLDDIREGKVKVLAHTVDVLLEAIDVIKEMLQYRSEGQIYEDDISKITSDLKSLLGGANAGNSAAETSVPRTNESQESPSVPGTDKETLSEYDILELLEAADEGEKVYEIIVNFNEDHPMNSIGGIQVFAGLKSSGVVLKTIPDFEELYEDVFHPEIVYYIATSQTEDYLLSKLNIPGVVSGNSIIELNSSTSTSKSEVKPEVPEVTVEEKQGTTVKVDEKLKETDPVKEKTSNLNKSKNKELKKNKDTGSVLRVDSRRIDNLLNLVSETVITKATLNQIGNDFSFVETNIIDQEKQFKDGLKSLIDSLPGYIEKSQDGYTVKEIKTELNENFGELFTIFEKSKIDLRNTIVKFRSTAQNLARTTSELQEGVMQIRMVPISQIFSRFPRLVRDASKSLSKSIKLNLVGEDTELDKSVIEDLLDPLIHCVRNSVDHGIESPEERIKAGKPPEGIVTLKARNEGSMIIIEIEDDGKGIDVEAVRAKAIDRGVIHPSKVLSDIEAFNLIFDAGFSTAKQVSDISGRGVGLDVVKRKIEKLNGNVNVWSEVGVGSTLTIKIPLTLAIIQALLVRVGPEVYAIPITSVIDSHRIKPSDIKVIDGYEVFNVREDVISLIRLDRLFNISTESSGEYNFVVIVGSGDKKMGLMVDSLIGEEDVVIKPLKDRYTSSPGVAGATILGDGIVALIIDVSQLLELGLKQEIENRRRRSASIM
ncbi:MAG: chemotaxis protein CheA [Spirochaetes bacterium]|nr:MAG: chemotaxis protein CheA [Spirochaetota bacterium]